MNSNVIIESSYVSAGAVLQPFTKVMNSDVWNSTLMTNSEIQDSIVGDNSTIGTFAKIKAGSNIIKSNIPDGMTLIGASVGNSIITPTSVVHNASIANSILHEGAQVLSGGSVNWAILSIGAEVSGGSSVYGGRQGIDPRAFIGANAKVLSNSSADLTNIQSGAIITSSSRVSNSTIASGVQIINSRINNATITDNKIGQVCNGPIPNALSAVDCQNRYD